MRKSQTRIEHEDAKLSNDPLKLEYEDYLRNQRGLSERTSIIVGDLPTASCNSGSGARRATCIRLRRRT
jgi:hypothetical protein